MFGVTDYWAFALGALLIILLPGPNSIYVLTVAARDGVASGYRAAAGVALGDSLLMVLSVGGVASLLRTHPQVFQVVKYLGGGYLVWIGVGLLRSAVAIMRRRQQASAATTTDASTIESAVESTGDVRRLSWLRREPFVAAFVLCMLNPKSILFFVAFFVQFINPADPHPVRGFLVLAATMQLLSVIYLSALIFGGSHLAERMRRHRRVAAGAKTGIGLVFMAFGLKLATVSVH